MTCRLENWAVRTHYSDPYMPPEVNPPCLEGKVFGHPKHADGKHVKTSAIVSAKGRVVTTEHSEYYLGRPQPAYLKWLKEQGREYNAKQPVSTASDNGQTERRLPTEPNMFGPKPLTNGRTGWARRGG